jgi:hypothetical protein
MNGTRSDEKEDLWTILQDKNLIYKIYEPFVKTNKIKIYQTTIMPDRILLYIRSTLNKWGKKDIQAFLSGFL